MSFNTFGHLFRVTTFGESHGIAIGCVVDGCPPLLPLTDTDIQHDLDRRRPGQSRFTTQRQEPDTVRILSGVMAHPDTGVQVTTGTPIALLIENTDQRSKDYSDIKDKFRRDAHFTYQVKYGVRDDPLIKAHTARVVAKRKAEGLIVDADGDPIRRIGNAADTAKASVGAAVPVTAAAAAGPVSTMKPGAAPKPGAKPVRPKPAGSATQKPSGKGARPTGKRSR